jgi:hypothetical protein
LSCAAPTPPMLRYQATELLQGISRFIKPTSNNRYSVAASAKKAVEIAEKKKPQL